MPIAPVLAAVGSFAAANAVPLAIGAAGLAGSAISAGAAKSAANTQAAAANQATSVQQAMFNQTRQDLGTFRDFGASAQGSLGKLLGLDTGSGTGTGSTAAPQVGAPNWDAYLQANPDVMAWAQAGHGDPNIPIEQQSLAQRAAYQYQNSGHAEGRTLPTFTAADVPAASASTGGTNSVQAALEALPGYQFARDQGVQTVNRQLGSMGLTGAQAKGIARFVTGLADQTYGNQVQRLQNAVNTGENAAAQTGNIGATFGQGISNTIVGAGTAQAAGTVGAANAASAGLSSIPNALLFNKLFSGGGGGGSAGIYSGAGGSIPFDPGIPGS